MPARTPSNRRCLKTSRQQPGCRCFLLLLAATVLGSPLRANDLVAAGGTSQTPSFLNEIVPLFTRLGCNQGACHGKGEGQNGFKLSLRGYAPELDHVAITREHASRRVSLAAPKESLLYLKAAGIVPHGGGRLIGSGSRAETLLLNWLTAGAPGPLPEDRRLEQLELSPAGETLKPGDTRSLVVRARYSDGQWEDVTWLSTFASNDAGLLEVSPEGQLTVLQQGETAVRAHFQGLVSVATFTVPYDVTVPAERLAVRNNVIDEHVFNKLAALGIPPADLSSDEQFHRRAFLDAIGTLPTPEEVRQFLADPSPDKRARLVDRLLQRPEFNEYWALQLGDLLQNRRERDHDVRGTKGVRAMHQWLRAQVAANRPWDQLAREVLLATGRSDQTPAVGYYIVTVGEKREPEKSEVVASVAQAFLGTRIGCAQCHNHPLEKYTQDDYYHFAAFFSRVHLDRQEPQKGPTTLTSTTQEAASLTRRIEQAEENLAKAEDDQKREQLTKQLESMRKQLAEAQARPVGVTQPRTNQFLAPQPLDRTVMEFEPGSDPRQQLVDWMTAPGNEYFSGAMVNRIWRHYLGVGLVEPVDDLRASNPPSNPPLWQALNREFVGRGFDLRHIMRLILNSRTYQLSSTTSQSNAADNRFYSHYNVRRLPAEVLLDAICQATGVPESFPGYPLGLRATQLPDPGLDSYFLGLFGRSPRTTACACERQGEVNLPQLLHLQNGDSVVPKIASPESRLAALWKEHSQPGPVIDELFLATFSRLPTARELATIEAALAEGESTEEVLRDIFWALINSKEFTFNH